MVSQTFLKLTTLLSVFIFLSGNAMKPQRSIGEICAEVKNNVNLYGDIYKSDLAELIASIRENTFAKTIAILEQMADNTANYTDEDKNNLLAFVQTYAQELYRNELIGFNAVGTLTKHKNILCHINAQCRPTLNPNNENDTQTAKQSVISKKSHSPVKKNIGVEKKQTLEPVDTFATGIQTNINTIIHARTLAHLRQNNIDAGDDAAINKSTKKWFAEFLIAIQDAVTKQDKNLLNDLWRANFNNNTLHFKARETEIKDSVLKKLQKNNTDEASITWFIIHVNQIVYAKETKPIVTLKSRTKPQVTESVVKPTPAPQVIPLSQKIISTLMQLNHATELDTITEILNNLTTIFNSEARNTLKNADIATLKFEIEESMNGIYQNCLLGLYGNHEQKLQQHVFEICADQLILLNTQLSIQLKESDKVINTYVNNANKRKQAFLYEIKVIRDAEKVATPEEVKIWETVINDRLSSQLEGQNGPALQKTIEANFDASKTPLLAEQYKTIVPSIYNQKNTGTTWPKWLEENKHIFKKPGVQMDDVPTDSILQVFKNHWILSSCALAVVVAGIYYAWEQCYGEDEEDKQLIQQESAVAEAKADKETEKSTASHQNNKAKTA